LVEELEPVGVVAVAAVGGATARRQARHAPGSGAQGPQEGRGVEGSRPDLGVGGRRDDAAVARPVTVETEEEVLEQHASPKRSGIARTGAARRGTGVSRGRLGGAAA